MPLHPTWTDIVLRIGLTLLAGVLVGLDRSVRGQAAGLRTTMLVGTAACLAMIQANVLLPVDGKSSSSFAVMDLMRLPLGVLTGVGFIGGGAILKRGDMVTGVTTAATLWMMTVIGLCFGGGQLRLGGLGTAIAVVTVLGLKSLDLRIPREHRAILTLSAAEDADPAVVERFLSATPYRARFRRLKHPGVGAPLELEFDVRWKRPEIAAPPFDLMARVSEGYAIVSLELTTEPAS